MRGRNAGLLAAAIVTAGVAVVWILGATGPRDKMEDLWPDPRDRQGVRLRLLAKAAGAFAIDHNRHPANLDELIASMRDEVSAAADLRTDVWGTVVQYSTTRAVAQLRSAGPDSILGNADDITASSVRLDTGPEAQQPPPPSIPEPPPN